MSVLTDILGFGSMLDVFTDSILPLVPSITTSEAARQQVLALIGQLEIAAAGRAAIFIPFGRATDSHQLRNAQEMTRAGAGRLISEAELTAEKLTGEIFSLLDQPREIEKLSTAARGLARPYAAREIVNLIEEAANVQGNRQRASA